MAYNEDLALRVRDMLSDQPDVVEKKMMGGLTFMVNDKMCVGVYKNDLICRLSPEEYAKAIKQDGCKPMDFTGRPLKSFVVVNHDIVDDPVKLQYWINLSLEYNKAAKASKKRVKKK